MPHALSILPPTALLLAALLAPLHSLAAEDAIILNDAGDRFGNGREVFVLKDITKNLGIDEVASPAFAGKFQRGRQETLNFGYDSSACWIRFRLKNESTKTEDWLLELAHPILDRVELHYKDETGKFQRNVAGDLSPFNARDFKHRYIVFKLHVPRGQEETFYLRIRTNNSFVVPLRIWETAAFAAKDRREHLALGLIYGIVVAMLLYNLFLFASLRDVSYLYYIFFIGCIGLYKISINGQAGEYLWPASPWWADRAPVFFIIPSVFCAFLFTRSFLSLRTLLPFWDRTFLIAIFVNVALALVSLTADAMVASILASASTIFSVLLILLASILALRKGYRPARYYLIAWLFFLCAVPVNALRVFGVIDDYFISLYSVQVGSALLMILLSLGLANRINMIKREKEEAQADALLNQRLAVENLRKADKLRDEFLANTSHELRTPLHGIIGIAESLLDGAVEPLSERTRRNLALIVSSGRRLANLVNDILDFSQLKHKSITLSLRPVSMHDIAELILTLCAPLVRDKNLTLVNSVAVDLPPVDADENRLQQIMYNLIGNAIKFTRQGRVEVSAVVQDAFLEVTVSDNGIGIPLEKQQIIFAYFEQADGSISREYGGTGLGLAVTRQLVELHGGAIRTESAPGAGSKFIFTLPLSKEKADAMSLNMPAPVSRVRDYSDIFDIEKIYHSHSPVSNDVLDAFRYRILIVDDEPVNLQVLTNHLQNFSLTKTSNPNEALEMIRRVKFDLALLDVMMPGVNGLEVCRKIRETLAPGELPIILLTARNQIQDLVEGFNAGANDYLAKPISKSELLARVNFHLNLGWANRELKRLKENLEELVQERTSELNEALNMLHKRDRIMQMELDVAGEIQGSILPVTPFRFGDLNVVSHYQSMGKVGGDFFDLVLPVHDRLAVLIADVSGHGVPAALLTTMLKITFAEAACRYEFPQDILQHISDVVSNTIKTQEYLTAFCVTFESDLHATHSNAGHRKAIVLRAASDKIETWHGPGSVIGFYGPPQNVHVQKRDRLHPGDRLFLYTDGLIDATNPAGERFETERLETTLLETKHLPPEEQKERLLKRWRDFTQNEPIKDDVCFLILAHDRQVRQRRRQSGDAHPLSTSISI